jgi:hypothetical protein
VERVEKERFNGTPHFYSLPQGERRDERKKFKRPPYPDPLPRGGEERRKMKRFKHSLTLPSPAEWRGLK